MRDNDRVSNLEPLVLRGRVVTPERVVADGAVVVEGERLAWVGAADEVPRRWSRAVRATGPSPDTLLPGLVDLHNHGGGGVSFPEAGDVEAVRTAVREHLAHGTTRLVASLVTAPAPVLVERVRTLAAVVATGEVAGIHLEGPFLSALRCGAQDPRAMVPGDVGLVHEVALAADGAFATMTYAPEVAGSPDVVRALARGGAVPSIGHTDASAEQTRASIDLALEVLAADGTRSRRPTATHLFNAMRPLHHREPGPAGECLAAAARGELVVELVADGVHLADATTRMVFDLVGADNIALVTDAMAATGMPDGDYVLGGLGVTVSDGVARLAEGGAIAGGTAHLLDVVRRTVGLGVPLEDAVRAASLVPAGVLGRDDVGALLEGRLADVVVADDELAVRAVYRAGERVA